MDFYIILDGEGLPCRDINMTEFRSWEGDRYPRFHTNSKLPYVKTIINTFKTPATK